jgi:hypothetical protein
VSIDKLASVLMNLSKAFDCLPHAILLDKLSAFGVSDHSVSLLQSYLSNRKQQIKARLWRHDGDSLFIILNVSRAIVHNYTENCL